jgi:hypothetical protein
MERIQYEILRIRYSNEYGIKELVSLNQPNLENTLRSRGVTGDLLLNVFDIIDELNEVDCLVDGAGYVLLFHATNPEKAKTIVKEQKMFGKENGLFFSTKPNGQIAGYGKSILSVLIPIEKLQLDDDFGDELHCRVEVKPFVKVPFAICHYQVEGGR